MVRLRFVFWPVLVAMALTAGCAGEQESAPIIRPVRYVQVFASGGARERTFSGVAQAAVESELSFRVAGTVQRVSVAVGDRVRVGQLIAQLDPEDYRLQQQDAEAALRRAEAQERNANANYERVRGLYETQNASLNELDAARTAYESARAQVRSAQNRNELARLQLSYTRLTAPAAGQIASVDVDVNENVGAGHTVAMLTSGSELEVEVAVPEILIARIREGDQVTVTFDALPGRSIAAQVSEVGVVAGGFATTYPVTVSLEQAVEELRPGMAAEVSFRFAATGAGERILVPPSAVGEDRDGRHVFVVQPLDSGLGIALRRPVTVGELTEEGLEVLEGLFDEELVVTAGVSRLRDSLRVRLPGMARQGS
ncbi:MAG: efflux RND transporter periplasmic adaptor subunit [Gemmatimonadales bacterium]|nr:efflux RND transporter periplasmic adaptor subunit [Gemmatimonadales bacterium]NIN13042.1 efflux RND transporter periplasmic adaptor subunit [Gemmatimonadales bacterium]NIN51126.1 efflux RND transporter periplasmic adaptor subunit [Gemmatimonadales bacterium]NIP08590.1 efflux RND transporter periplasmic adaptor subunit [Gemmatimonadales bacterium]NIQ99700.1 efflux RND transporter periplasmic adaptor subunit [Gemmatimonadales bacterium]